jgi:dTDP-4-dehydrorhamnose reductase
MGSKRIMLLGAGGQVGQALRAETLPVDWQLGAYSRNECDITNHRQVREVIQSFKPDIVINAAAMTAVDKCETEQDAARAANFDGPANLAAQCSAIDAPLIHLSTDYVFDGSEARPYRPDDLMNPLSFYGESKMMGEEALRHESHSHVILRISSLFSQYSSNLLTKALQNIDTRDEMKIVTDQKSCPTYAPDVAKALIKIADAILRGKTNGFGAYHYCGEGPVNRLEFTQAIMDAYAPHTKRRPVMLPALSADFPGFAVRPPYSVLDCAKTASVYGIQQRPWREGLAEAMQVLMRDQEQHLI